MNSLSTPPPYWALLFGYVVVGVPFSVGVIDTVAAMQASTGTQETLGTIVAFERGRSSAKGGGAVSKPVVEYHVAGQTYRCKGAVSTNLPIHAIGDPVSVLYKVHDPGTAFIDSFFDRWLCPLAFTVAGFGFLSLLTVVTVQKIKGAGTAAPSAARPGGSARRTVARSRKAS